uniref:Alpha-2,8-sialyltransferase 8E n=1 Tax=Leptobrachium leishanense TaxID=445787 RepID=A0A8C5P8W6_9ANUR
MGYADPTSSRDLLGSRTLFFIFICAFALVTLLQQILYGRNYIKRGLQFSWQTGEELGNWTGIFNFTDDGAVKTGSHAGGRYFEFYEGPLDFNSTKCLELRQDIMDVKVLSMVKESELFERWKSLQICKWQLNTTEANSFKSALSRCCNAPTFLVTTQKNTPLGTKLRYEVDTSGIFQINSEIFKIFPKDSHDYLFPVLIPVVKRCRLLTLSGPMASIRNHVLMVPAGWSRGNITALRGESLLRHGFDPSKSTSPEMPYYRSQFKKCAVIGNGGILKNSRCGKEIDNADFVFRCNLPPISEKYIDDVGKKTDVVTINPSIITDRFNKLEKWRRPFFEVLQEYENASLLLPAFYNTRNTDVSIRVKYVLDDFESQQAVYYFHPLYLINVSRFWLTQGVRAKRVSSGLILVTAALELCEEVHLYGFWGFPMNPSGIFITHHYYDNVKPRPGFHAMPSEIFNFIHMHSKGILRVHTGSCS